jgi:hypothetical protein
MSVKTSKRIDVYLPEKAAKRTLELGTADLADNLNDTLRAVAPRQSHELESELTYHRVDSLTYSFEGASEHTRYVLEGTGIYGPEHQPYFVAPHPGGVLHWTEGGRDYFSRGHWVQGMQPENFVETALEIEQPRVEVYYAHAAGTVQRSGV